MTRLEPADQAELRFVSGLSLPGEGRLSPIAEAADGELLRNRSSLCSCL